MSLAEQASGALVEDMMNLSIRNHKLNSNNTTRHLNKIHISSHLINKIHTNSHKPINSNLNTSSNLSEAIMAAIRSKNNSNHSTMPSQELSRETSITSAKVIDRLHGYMRRPVEKAASTFSVEGMNQSLNRAEEAWVSVILSHSSALPTKLDKVTPWIHRVMWTRDIQIQQLSPIVIWIKAMANNNSSSSLAAIHHQNLVHTMCHKTLEAAMSQLCTMRHNSNNISSNSKNNGKSLNISSHSNIQQCSVEDNNHSQRWLLSVKELNQETTPDQLQERVQSSCTTHLGVVQTSN